MELTLIIPTYNEESHIAQTVHTLYNNLATLSIDPEVLVIDDSTDNTPIILQKLQSSYPRLRMIHRTTNKGLGTAFREGITQAQGKYLAFIMGDAPDDVQFLPSMLTKLREGKDLVQGSRFIQGSKLIGYPPKKRVANWLCNTAIRILYGNFRQTDFTNAFRAMNTESARNLDLDATSFDITIEIILKAMNANYSIVEVPVHWIERLDGDSKLVLGNVGSLYLKRLLRSRFLE